MNIAALFSGPVVNFCSILNHTPNNILTIMNMTDMVKDSTMSNMSENETILQWEFSGYVMVILAGIIVNILACMISFTMKEIRVNNNNNNDYQTKSMSSQPSIRNDSKTTTTTTTTTRKFHPL